MKTERKETKAARTTGRMTNADRIRAMTDEELAVFLSKTQANVARTAQMVVAYRAEAVQENLEWLREIPYGRV